MASAPDACSDAAKPTRESLTICSRLSQGIGRIRHSMSFSHGVAGPWSPESSDDLLAAAAATAVPAGAAVRPPTQSQSPFLRLPLEIRCMIWQDCVSSLEVSAWTTRRAREGFAPLQGSARPFKRVPTNVLGLLLICKRTYQETRDILYAKLVLILPGSVALAQFPGRLFQNTPREHLQRIRQLVCVFNEDPAAKFDDSNQLLSCYDLKKLLVAHSMHLQWLVLRVNFKATRGSSTQARDRATALENELRASLADMDIACFSNTVRLVFQYASHSHLDHKAVRFALPTNCLVERRWPRGSSQVTDLDSTHYSAGNVQLEDAIGEVIHQKHLDHEGLGLSPYHWYSSTFRHV